jgi:hypothetical protein
MPLATCLKESGGKELALRSWACERKIFAISVSTCTTLAAAASLSSSACPSNLSTVDTSVCSALTFSLDAASELI